MTTLKGKRTLLFNIAVSVLTAVVAAADLLSTVALQLSFADPNWRLYVYGGLTLVSTLGNSVLRFHTTTPVGKATTLAPSPLLSKDPVPATDDRVL